MSPSAASADVTVCFGELLLRLSAPRRELLLQTPRFDVHVGGAEANVAVGLASLGHSTRMVSRVPEGPLGEAACIALRGRGVDTSHVRTGPGRMGLYFLAAGAGARASEIVYDRAGSTFARASSGNFDWDAAFAGAARLHLSGITPALGRESADLTLAVLAAARARGMAISFDLNHRANLWNSWLSDPGAVLHEMVARADILFGNHRDAALLLRRDLPGKTADQRRAASEALFAAFPNLQLIASTVRHAESVEHHQLAARIDRLPAGHETEPVTISGIVDRIGSGDAFAAGVLHSLISGYDAERTARTGLALACLKHSLPGDQSLFKPRDVDAFWAGERDIRR